LPLARTLLFRAARRAGRKLAGLSPRAAEAILRHAWPGNVRELENALERAVALAQGRRVDIEDLPESVRRAPPAVPSVAVGVRPLEVIEREYILSVLEANSGNQVKTAVQLRISASTLYRKLKRYAADAGDRRTR
jgi:DNA-binding NtrC family response regulator